MVTIEFPAGHWLLYEIDHTSDSDGEKKGAGDISHCRRFAASVQKRPFQECIALSLVFREDKPCNLTFKQQSNLYSRFHDLLEFSRHVKTSALKRFNSIRLRPPVPPSQVSVWPAFPMLLNRLLELHRAHINSDLTQPLIYPHYPGILAIPGSEVEAELGDIALTLLYGTHIATTVSHWYSASTKRIEAFFIWTPSRDDRHTCLGKPIIGETLYWEKGTTPGIDKRVQNTIEAHKTSSDRGYAKVFLPPERELNGFCRKSTSTFVYLRYAPGYTHEFLQGMNPTLPLARGFAALGGAGRVLRQL